MNDKIDYNKLATLLSNSKKREDLSQEELIEIRDIYKKTLDNLPEKLKPQEQSELEISVRAEYKEICNALRTNGVR